MMQLLHSMALHGIDGQRIAIEIDVQNGIPSCSIVGLWDTSIQESRERIRAAVKNSGFEFPSRRVTINLAPAHIRKTGSHFDLAIAVGLTLPSFADSVRKTSDSGFGKERLWSSARQKRLSETLILGELALDGGVRRIIGALPLVLSAIKDGWKRIILPAENLFELQEIEQIEIIGVRTLREAAEYFELAKLPETPEKFDGQLREKAGLLEIASSVSAEDQTHSEVAQTHESITKNKLEINRAPVLLESIFGQSAAKRALMIAAAGRHNLLMEWPPGSGKSMLAGALPGILPPLTQSERMEIAQVYSVAGMLCSGDYISARPFRQVHHTASAMSIIGGGSLCRPGEISLAHRGVLFLDEFLEFDRKVLETLREPLETREIHISRIHGTFTYPSSFMLVGAMNPCPCGYLGDAEKPCTDTSAEIAKYRSKLSGPIQDRIDLRIVVPRIKPDGKLSIAEALTTLRARELVSEAHRIALSRQNKPNAELTPDEVVGLAIEEDAKELLLQAVDRLTLSLRSYHRILRVSRTIADLGADKKITSAHVAEALSYR